MEVVKAKIVQNGRPIADILARIQSDSSHWSADFRVDGQMFSIGQVYWLETETGLTGKMILTTLVTHGREESEYIASGIGPLVVLQEHVGIADASLGSKSDLIDNRLKGSELELS